MKSKFRDFESAREFARSLNLKGDKGWREYCKSGNKPADIPSNPDKNYKNNGYVDSGDWLGTGHVASKDAVFRSFVEAREFARNLGLKGKNEWEAYCKSGNKPNYIPSSPKNNYKKDFKGFGDWLGTGHVASKDAVFRSFVEAREFARNLKLKNITEWREYCKSGNKPNYVPSNPNKIYKNEFKGVGDWLGNEWRSFEEARHFVRKLGLKNHKEWFEYCKSGDKPDDIPVKPWNSYKEWKKK
jgi:hypothetical protein